MEGTITQQTKLIDFLQSQAHGGSKKKKVSAPHTPNTHRTHTQPPHSAIKHRVVTYELTVCESVVCFVVSVKYTFITYEYY